MTKPKSSISRSPRASNPAVWALGATLALSGGFGAASAQEAVRPVPAVPQIPQTLPTAPVRAVPILTVNQEAMFAGSALGQRVLAELERDRDALATENRRIEQSLGEEEQGLTQRRGAMSGAEFSALATAFNDKVQSIRAEQDRKARVLQERFQAERQGFAAGVGPILAEIARDRGAFAVLDDAVVLISADAIDITAEAIARLDAKFGDGRLDLSAPSTPEATGLPDPERRPAPRNGPLILNDPVGDAAPQ